MIFRISNAVMRYIKKNCEQKITKEEETFYRYGIEIIISSIASVTLILILGMGINMIIESIIFLICFTSLRQYIALIKGSGQND